jgi:ribosomal protein S18 acetylase RimI-like enzyme
MMISQIPRLQPATPDISFVAADLLYLTMGHTADYLFGADGPQAARQTLEKLFRASSNRFSHQFTGVVTLSGKTAGLALAYSGRTMKSLEMPTALRLLQASGIAGFLRFLGRALPLATIKEAEDDDYFISNLAVLPECQGHGLGSAMLSQVEQQARALGFRKLSLTVDIENERACALYQRTGFKVIRTLKIEPLRRRFGSPGLYRMLKNLT